MVSAIAPPPARLLHIDKPVTSQDLKILRGRHGPGIRPARCHTEHTVELGVDIQACDTSSSCGSMRRTPFCEISVEVMWKHVEDSDFVNSNSTDPLSLALLNG